MDPRLTEFLSRPVALTPSAWAGLARRGPRADGPAAFAAYRDGAEPYTRFGSVAHVPVSGPICFGDGYFCWLFGMTSSEALAAALHDAAEDDTVSAVLLDIDSPGGDVYGMADLVAACAAVRDSGTRLVACVHDAAFSGAYWLASQADELCVTPTGECGSIGAFRLYFDSSKFYDEELKTSARLVASTELKGMGLPGVEITERQMAAAADPVGRMHAAFVAAVAAGRGVDEETVAGWSGGPDAFGAEAVERGMADRVVDFRGLLEELASPAATQGAGKMTTQTKSGAAVSRAAGKAQGANARGAGDARPKAEGDEMTTEEMQARIEELEEENTTLKGEKEDLEKKLDGVAETDTGDDEEDDPKPAAFGLGEYKAAFAKAEIPWDDKAKAFAVDAIDDELTPRAAARVFGRLAEADSKTTRARGESTEPLGVANGGGGGGSAKARYEQAIAKAMEGGKTKAQAAEHVHKAQRALVDEMLDEVNAK